MDGLSLAASVIAVIDLSATVIKLCFNYYSEVRNAKPDIQRLQGELDRLKTILEALHDLLQSPDGARLSTSHKLSSEIKCCEEQLRNLEITMKAMIEPGPGAKMMSLFGYRALKWPFERKNVNNTIRVLERYRDAIASALNVDQTRQVLDTNQNLVLSKLQIANDAAFDSYADEHDARCHPGTRVSLREDILKWAEDPQGECIFWLNGMAGTGKSTISRTVAQSFHEKGCLGASFFFKRGERDRGNAALMFTTIASQLVVKNKALAVNVKAAIEADPAISSKALAQQYEKLIFEPLEHLKVDPNDTKRIILVIDALDECDRGDDIQVILSLLSRAKSLSSVQLRAFVTSRPELPIQLGFSRIKEEYKNTYENLYKNLVLHEIQSSTIEHDITVFLKYKLAKTREDHNFQFPDTLPPDWPGPKIVQSLVQTTVPLFIFAATVCRFIADPAWSDPAGQLKKVIGYQSSTHQCGIDKLDATYRPTLDNLVLKHTQSAKESLLVEFRMVVGWIILLAQPLSTSSLSRLLGVEKIVVDRRLATLHSVLCVPPSTEPESPVRLFHLSFRDFLTDPEKRLTNPFWIDERETHEAIAGRCLKLLDSDGHLKKDLCDLRKPGMLRTSIDPKLIKRKLPAEIRYACLQWVYHLEQGKICVTDKHEVYAFLKRHFLHWLEAMALMGEISVSVIMITALMALISPKASINVSAFLHDAMRFMLSFNSIIDVSPLQVYYSAMVFTPHTSIVRDQFRYYIPEWIPWLPKVESNWNACLQILEGHRGWVNAVSFSPDGKMLASGSKDGTIRLWDPTTGVEKQIFKGHNSWVNTVVISTDGKVLASASNDNTIRLWHLTTGVERILRGHDGRVKSVAFSPDGKTLASASGDATIILWDPIAGHQKHVIRGHADYVKSVAFSPDGKILASASQDCTIRLWDPLTGDEKSTFRGHQRAVNVVTFSPDGRTLASASDDTIVRFWNLTTGQAEQLLEGHCEYVSAAAFSSDGKSFASASKDRTIRFWDPVTGKSEKIFDGHSDSVNDVTFSHDGRFLASAANDGTIRLWDCTTGNAKVKPSGHTSQVNAIAFSIDGKLAVTGSSDCTVRLWDIETGNNILTLEGHDKWVNAVAFTPDGKTIVSGSSDFTVRLWSLETSGSSQILTGHQHWVNAVAFSVDGMTVGSASYDETIRLWDVITGTEKHKLDIHSRPCAIAFSSDGTTLMSASVDKVLRYWSVTTGAELRKFEIDTNPADLSFSNNGQFIKTVLGYLDWNCPLSSFRWEWPENTVLFDKDWVYRNNEKLLWLPKDYRPTAVSSSGDTFALGCASGLVMFIRFAFP